MVVNVAFSDTGTSLTDSTIKSNIWEVTFSPSEILKLIWNVPISSTVGVPDSSKPLIWTQSGDSLITIYSIVLSVSATEIV